MASKETVLVLGAGVSKPYGFPLGQYLLVSVDGILGNGEVVELLGQCNLGTGRVFLACSHPQEEGVIQ